MSDGDTAAREVLAKVLDQLEEKDWFYRLGEHAQNLARADAILAASRSIPAAAALLREAGWRVEEPRCETCQGIGQVAVYPIGTLMCGDCNGTGKRKVGE